MKIKNWLIILSANLLIAAMLIWFYPSTGDFRCDNPFWNGYLNLAEVLRAETITDMTRLTSASKSVALILVPYTPLEDSELASIEGFVRKGGVLIIMDDYGYGNTVLEKLNVGIRFTGKPILDPLFNYKSPTLPKCIKFSEKIEGVESIVLNHGSTLNVSGGAEVLAWSSSFSFLDLDGDSDWDPGEPHGPFPVAARVRLGGGWLIAVSDPSIAINSMLSMDDNMSFIRKVLELHGVVEVLIDQSHIPMSRLDEAKEVLQTIYSYASSPVGAIAILTLTLIVCLKPLWAEEVKKWTR
ncbi:MAG: DUF4350 domain-containing protein [Candidatus Bathyarchaeia archaeon]